MLWMMQCFICEIHCESETARKIFIGRIFGNDRSALYHNDFTVWFIFVAIFEWLITAHQTAYMENRGNDKRVFDYNTISTTPHTHCHSGSWVMFSGTVFELCYRNVDFVNGKNIQKEKVPIAKAPMDWHFNHVSWCYLQRVFSFAPEATNFIILDLAFYSNRRKNIENGSKKHY